MALSFAVRTRFEAIADGNYIPEIPLKKKAEYNQDEPELKSKRVVFTVVADN